MSVTSENTLVQTANWFKQAVPEPTSKNLNTQLGCHLEEVLELLVELDSKTPYAQTILSNAIGALNILSETMKASPMFAVNEEQRVAVLDALCDQVVTASGIAVFLGMDLPGGMDEVNRSNYSKFVDGQPVFNENKKVMKGSEYTPPDLTPFV